MTGVSGTTQTGTVVKEPLEAVISTRFSEILLKAMDWPM
jgi:hypothetical protein